MCVEMEYRLSGNLPVVLHDIETVPSQFFLQKLHHLPGQRKYLCTDSIIQCLKTVEMVFGYYKAVPFRCRRRIKEYAEILILIDRVRRDIPVCQLAENTIILFHFQISLSIMVSFGRVQKSEHLIQQEKYPEIALDLHVTCHERPLETHLSGDYMLKHIGLDLAEYIR